MQTNHFLKPKTVLEINGRIEKLLKDLGNPDPPIRLVDVRELLKLDLRYYSTSNHSWLSEKVHQLKVAGKQVISEPSSILSVVKNLGLKGVLLSDRRRILLDEDVPKPKHRWNEAHEITHDVLPWHEGIAHGDPETTLSPGCHEQIEAEANYGAGRLLFLGQRFESVARSSPLSISTIQSIRTSYGNTMTTALWRLVELSLDACFGLVTGHPRGAAHGDGAIRYFIRSPRFITEFPAVVAGAAFQEVRTRCFGRRGPIGSGSFALDDSRGDSREFEFECFFNGHDALTIARCAGTRKGIIVVPA